jgi:hypothetical protein
MNRTLFPTNIKLKSLPIFFWQNKKYVKKGRVRIRLPDKAIRSLLGFFCEVWHPTDGFSSGGRRFSSRHSSKAVSFCSIINHGSSFSIEQTE